MSVIRKIVLLALAAMAIGYVLRPVPVGGPFTGTIEADEARLASRTGGRVVHVLAREGDVLTNQQMVVLLEAAEWMARRDKAAALLQELENGPREEDRAAAKSQWDALNAELDFARTDARRQEELFKEKVVADTERDRAISREKVLEAEVEAARQRYEALVAGTRVEQIDQARAALAEVQSQLDETTIRSPGPCTLESLHVKPGDVAGPGTAIATVLFSDSRWVRIFVPANQIGSVTNGQSTAVKVDAFGDAVFTGRVIQVGREAEFTPRNVQTIDERVKQVYGVKIQLPADDRLHPGMTADVDLPR